jgi:FKBP-type peptidyl-prolyl cis-trans isomerase
MITGTMRRTIQTAALTALAVIIVSCNPSKKYEEEEKSLIEDYVAENNITVSPDADGLYFMEIEPGTGELIRTGDSVGVYYTLMFLSGEELQSNVEENTPYRFRVGSYELIEGWSIGLVKMKLGTKAKLLMPSSIAYGTMGYGYYDYYGNYYTVIPGYTPLLFEIEVVELVRARK